MIKLLLLLMLLI